MIFNLIPFPPLPVLPISFFIWTGNVILKIWWRSLGLPQKWVERHFVIP